MEVYLVLLIMRPFLPFVKPSFASGGLLSSFDQACTSWGGFLIFLMFLFSFNTYLLFPIKKYKNDALKVEKLKSSSPSGFCPILLVSFISKFFFL